MYITLIIFNYSWTIKNVFTLSVPLCLPKGLSQLNSQTEIYMQQNRINFIDNN